MSAEPFPRMPHLSPAAVPPATVPVRRAQTEDLDALVELETLSFGTDRISRRQYRHHLTSDSAEVLVAGARGDCLGVAVVFFRRGSGVARLYSIASRAQARGQGVGAMLLDASERVARARGCRLLRLEVRVDNTAALRLYERLGYHRTGRCAGYYEDGADAWRCEKALL